ncbi:SIS domain-containing protein [Paracoccus aminophilus]|uniref:Glutamine--fructose-6-phosphate aminotransferase [isomerizing] n=1 Tax=Paracoccus aminophilus JCM 7686 TaxID=1367847 RepID=S5XX62_PARAH|nr:SIS domain-containing protein [Paracoccus aminophilus]AGT09907.1 sugar isomerase domain-containing protein [Paracoccus aminophilus JCM 7686]
MSYRSTVSRQPEALADSLAAAQAELAGLDLAPLGTGLVAVTGVGASSAAAVVVAAELQRRGRRAFAVRSGEMMAGHDLADIVLALSHRGRSVETVEALRKLPRAKSLAITNDSESPLAEAASFHVRLANGGDATPSSTGYTATLLVAGLAVDGIQGASGADWAGLPAQAAALLAGAAEKMPRLAQLFADRRAIDCVGAGASIGTADGASLLIREAARIPASGYETRHYLHGPMESMDETTGVVLFGDTREIELAHNLEEIGVPVLLVTSRQDIGDAGKRTVIHVPEAENLILRGILDIFAAQLLAAELSDAADLTDVQFRYKQTDTKILAA